MAVISNERIANKEKTTERIWMRVIAAYSECAVQRSAPHPRSVQKPAHLIRLAPSDSYIRATESRQNGSQRSQNDASALQFWSGVDTGRNNRRLVATGAVLTIAHLWPMQTPSNPSRQTRRDSTRACRDPFLQYQFMQDVCNEAVLAFLARSQFSITVRNGNQATSCCSQSHESHSNRSIRRVPM
jgi:hypothetical protein